MAHGGKRAGAGRRAGSLGSQAASLRAAFNRLEAAGELDRDQLIRQAYGIATMKTRDPKLIASKIKAIDVVFDRWFGRAPQAIEVSDADGASPFGAGELPEKLLRLVGLVARQGKGKP